MKNLRKLLKTITVLGFTTVSTINVVACNKSTFNNFQLVSDWNENNGEVYSLLNKNNGSIYVGTVREWNTHPKSNLFKIKNDDTLEEVAGWKYNTNGGILSLINSRDTIYIGTKTTGGKGKLFKSSYDI